MIRFVFPALILAIIVAIPCSATAQAARPPFYLNKDGFSYIVAEAEDFSGTGSCSQGQWEPGNYGDARSYFADSIGGAYMSRQRYLGAAEKGQGATAWQDVNVPRAGTYHAWARYESPYQYNTCFGVRIEQRGRVVFDEVYGGVKNVKLWPLNIGALPQMDWGYGGGDNVCWEGIKFTALLESGPARIVLYTAQNPAPAARRNVDVIMLTDDRSEDGHDTRDPWLNQLQAQGRLFLKITNKADKPACFMVPYTSLNRRPWGGPGWIMAKSGARAGAEVVPDDYLAPGEATPWMDIGQYLDATHQTTTPVNAKYADGGQGMNAALEFSSTPGEAGLLRQIEYSHPEKTRLDLTIPSNAPYDTDIYTLDEAMEKVWDQVKQFPEKGKIPSKIVFVGARPTNLSATEGADLARLKIAGKMGYNEIVEFAQSPSDLEILKNLGLPLVRSIQMTHYNPPSEEDCRKVAEQMGWKKDYLLTVSFGDEIHPSSQDSPEVKNQKFREYLRNKNLGPEEVLGRSGAQWEDVQLNMDRSISGTNPVLWYESMRFSQLNALEAFAAKTKWVEKYFGPEVHTGANYSPHPFYWPHPYAWVEAFKYRALTQPWSEDYNWQVPEEGPQMVGYLVDAFRAGAKYYDSPIEMYVMPHSPGNTSDDFRRISYSVIGRGAKIIYNFISEPQFFITENYVDWKDTDRRRAIYDVIRDTGALEDYLYDGRTPPAQVAILLSGATDIWETSKSEDTYNITDYHNNPNSNAYNHEMKCVWLALKHLQMPVDFLIEDDIGDGYLKNYKVLFIVGDHIDHNAAEGIRQWVANGGVLFSVAGGGLLDEYGRRLDALFPVYGITDANLEKRNIHIRTKMELRRLRSLDTITFDRGSGLSRTSMPVLAFKQTFLPAQGVEILGTYQDGTPALLRNQYGKGYGIICGTLPGAAYVRPAIPLLPWDRNIMAHFIPTNFGRTAQQVFNLPLAMAGVESPVQLSEPLVESNILASSKAVVIALSNYSKRKQIDRLDVTVKGLGSFKKVWSLAQGPLQFTRTENATQFSLPMGLTDFVVCEL